MASSKLSLILLTSTLCGGISLSKQYYDRRTALIIHYPDGWNVEEDWPAFTLISFPSERRPKQDVVPPNGAEIVILAPPKGVVTVEDWLAADRIHSDSGDKVSRENLTMIHFGTISAVVVKYKMSVIPEGEGTVFYFMLHGRPRKANLFYRGGTRSKYFEDVLKAVLTNLQPK